MRQFGQIKVGDHLVYVAGDHSDKNNYYSVFVTEVSTPIKCSTGEYKIKIECEFVDGHKGSFMTIMNASSYQIFDICYYTTIDEAIGRKISDQNK